MIYVGSKADLQKIAALVNKAEGRPKKGIHVGGGIHVEIPEAYAPGAHGWLGEISGETELAINDAKLAKLAASETLNAEEKLEAETAIGKVNPKP